MSFELSYTWKGKRETVPYATLDDALIVYEAIKSKFAPAWVIDFSAGEAGRLVLGSPPPDVSI